MHLTRKPREKHPRTSLPMAAALLLVLRATSAAHPFAGGTGKPRDPYQIATAEQLIAIGQDPNLADEHYVLVADIDLDPNLSPDYVFDGPVIDEFGGTLDGQGFCIRRLTIRRTNEVSASYVGLCGDITLYGEIKNLVLEDVEITFGTDAGGICGVNHGRIIGCSVSGTVTGEGDVGLLVGINISCIYRCQVAGIVTATDRDAGGLAGVNGGIIEQSSSFCTTTARHYSGGLVGNNGNKVRNSYALGEVFGGQSAGGLVGYQDWVVDNCYAACEVDGTGPSVGGLVGRMGSSGSETKQSYFLLGPDNGIGTLVTGDQIDDPTSFAGWDFWELGNDGFGVAWFMPEGGPPQLTWPALASIPDVRGLPLEEARQRLADADAGIGAVTFDYDPMVPVGCVSLLYPHPERPPGTLMGIVLSEGTYDWSAAPEAGTPDEPHWIFTAGQLECLAYEPTLWEKSFVLLADLDMAWRTYSEPLIGQADPEGVAFEGIFDGQGHIIENLTFVSGPFDNDDAVALGLFGRIGVAGNVYDLGLRDASVGGRRYDQAVSGMLCAINEGNIFRCYARGDTNWYAHLGGLVGRNAGAIQDCYAQGGVIHLGGRSDRTPSGGLVGENTTGTILTCYSTCIVISRIGGGLVGENTEGAVINSLWDTEASSFDRENGWGTGLSTSEMMDAQILQDNGWGGNPNWIIDDGRDYPRLIWEGTPGAGL